MADATKNRLNTVVNIAILAAILILLFGPTGPMGRWFIGWRAGSPPRALVESSWDDLIRQATIISKTPTPADTVVMFTDYECPFCRSVEPSVQLALACGQIDDMQPSRSVKQGLAEISVEIFPAWQMRKATRKIIVAGAVEQSRFSG